MKIDFSIFDFSPVSAAQKGLRIQEDMMKNEITAARGGFKRKDGITMSDAVAKAESDSDKEMLKKILTIPEVKEELKKTGVSPDKIKIHRKTEDRSNKFYFIVSGPDDGIYVRADQSMSNVEYELPYRIMEYTKLCAKRKEILKDQNVRTAMNDYKVDPDRVTIYHDNSHDRLPPSILSSKNGIVINCHKDESALKISRLLVGEIPKYAQARDEN